MPPHRERQKSQGNTHAYHQREQRRVKVVVHGDDAPTNHGPHRGLEHGHVWRLPLGPQHTGE